jgi:hypothetical protein
MIEPLLIEVFAKPAEQTFCRQFIERITAFSPEANWLLQSQFDRDPEKIYPIEESDCIVLLGGAEPFSPALLEQAKRFAQRGGAIIAINAGEQTSDDWREFAEEMLGASFGDNSLTSQKMYLRIAAGRHFHPIVEGVTAWEAECSQAAILDSRAELFLEGVGSSAKWPLAWGLSDNCNRAFCTLLGPQDFNQSSFFHLIRNALSWAMEMT